MKAYLAVALILLALARLGTAANGHSREVTARVLDEDGAPVAGVPVTLLGLDRGPMTTHPQDPAKPDDPDANKSKGWNFVTDADGRCTVVFGKFDFWEHLKSTGVAEPGYGSYSLIVEKEGYAGGVSPKLLNLSDEERKSYVPTKRGDSGPVAGREWNYNSRLLGDNAKELKPVKIVLKRGIDVSGRLEDRGGQPLPGLEVTLWNDLGADTHTGRGGEIFQRDSKTDGKGCFLFHHVYPNLFHLSIEGQGDDSLCWVKTRVRQRWVEGVQDAIWPHAGETDLPLVIVASREKPYRYFGKVMDEKGKPVAGATVQIQASIHVPGEMEDFEDSHGHFNQATTRKDGSYDVRSAGRYVNDFEITAPGYASKSYRNEGRISGIDRYEAAPCAPGRYDFVLKQK